jgi:hypothetical protein
LHSATGRKDIPQCPKAGIRIGKMVEHAGADDLVECPAELPDLVDREAMQIEVSQAVFLLKVALVA